MSFICDPEGNITKCEDQKTIRSLCKACDDCSDCSFHSICELSDNILHTIYHTPTGNIDITTAIIETARKLEIQEQDRLIADIKSDIDNLTRYQLTDKTQTISKKAVDRVFNLHLYGSRDAEVLK